MEKNNSNCDQDQNLREAVRTAYSGGGDAYDAVRGDESGKLLSEYDISIVKNMIPFVIGENARNLEVGSGTGRFTIPLLKMGYHITATDINDSLLESLRGKLDALKKWKKVCIVKIEDGFSLSFAGNHIDGLLCIHVIPRFKTKSDQLALLKEFSRVVKPGGKILFNFSNRRSLLYGKIYRGHLIAYNEVLDELPKLGFNVVKVRGKWLVNGTLFRAVPLWLRKAILFLDKVMQKVWVSHSWDVFILAERI